MKSINLRVDEEWLKRLDDKRKDKERSEFIREAVNVYTGETAKADVYTSQVTPEKGREGLVLFDGEWVDPYRARILALRKKAGRPISFDEEMTETIMPQKEWEEQRDRRQSLKGQ